MALRKAVQDDSSFDDDLDAAGRDWAPRLKPCGACHGCEQPVGPAVLFCSAACQQSFEHFEMRLLRKR
ncbi:hypothetical protein LMG19282_00224 [Cupriavidus campinensis]|uniref:DUF2116 family Zn-ribbon domain-containing protein n=1 Tax=Cupriavidus campinensis TaxID=151783 RepID=A0AAE9L4A8_9BURK|nr:MULTISPECIES: hypothetical protein [Cupriavidus]TSP12123.1 hypothetical protein FGG12_14000 [Cupriavidus campinensis]URF06224.1 hypothetical protein M5D45_24180 [Cupriavidus campinensis]CAG2129724.1 hypothetical protein LMG19282_00224 [Cupriavidus campinensis]